MSATRRRASPRASILSLRPGGRRFRVLCLGAHPDDIEIGCGASLMVLARRHPAFRMSWAVFSGHAEREAEARRSGGDWLGAGRGAAMSTFDFRDSYFPAQYEAIKEAMQALADRLAPDLVLTHYRNDRHQDHRVISDLTWSAFREATILEYEVPKWDGDLGMPNLYQPVTRADLERKIRQLQRTFRSQRNKDWFDPETFRGLARIRGMECRSPSGFAEAFHARKLALEPA